MGPIDEHNKIINESSKKEDPALDKFMKDFHEALEYLNPEEKEAFKKYSENLREYIAVNNKKAEEETHDEFIERKKREHKNKKKKRHYEYDDPYDYLAGLDDSWGKSRVIKTSHEREDIESYISNAKFGNVNF